VTLQAPPTRVPAEQVATPVVTISGVPAPAATSRKAAAPSSAVVSQGGAAAADNRRREGEWHVSQPPAPVANLYVVAARSNKAFCPLVL
jgi:hypothetical protein